MRGIAVFTGGGVPSTPTIGTATAGNALATVTFTPSTYIGKGTVSYELVSTPGNLNAGAVSSPFVIGVTNGTSYTFAVRAVTDYGVSSALSASSNSVTPAAPPAPPPGPPPPPPCNCTLVFTGYTCVGELSYEYFQPTTGGCGCPGEGGYNGAYRAGICGCCTPPACTGCGNCQSNGCGGTICYDSCGQPCSNSVCPPPPPCDNCGNIGPCCLTCITIKGESVCL